MRQLERDLLFVIDGVETILEITETVGSDAYADKLKQGSGRFGRDKTIGADDIPLTFWNGLYDLAKYPMILPDGNVIRNLTMGFEKLLEAYNKKGFEAVAFYRTKLNGLIYVNGQIDFAKCVTDEATYIKANIVQDTKRALVERRSDITTDVFASTDLDGNIVTPLERIKYLQQALPIVQSSELGTQDALQTTYLSYGADAMLFQPAQRIDKSGIEETYNPFNQFEYLQPGYGDPQVLDAFSRFKIIVAAEELTNLVVTLKNVSVNVLDQSGLPTNKTLQISWGASPLEGQREGKYEFIPNTQDNLIVNGVDFTFTIPKVFRGHTVWLLGQCVTTNPVISGTPSGSTSIYSSIEKIYLKTTSLAVDSVIDAVRYEDYLKTGVRNISGMPLSCPVYEPGGKYADLFVWNGNMQRLKDKPFNFQFKDRFTDEIRLIGCNDYQINADNVEILSYSDFYPNIELKAFDLIDAPTEIECSSNPRFQINKIEAQNSKYEKSEDAKNTVESFNTKTQYMPPNKQVENKIELTMNMILDGNKQERDRRLSIRDTTALESDNEVSMADSIMLAPGTIGTFTALLYQDYTDGLVYLYNIALDSNISAVFTWFQTGLEVGDYFAFDVPDVYNNAEHIVVEISSNVIKLQPTNYTSGKLGNATFTVRYNYNNVLYTQRFDQGFELIEGLSAPDRTANLRLSFGNLFADDNWTSYFNTICSAYPNGVIKNTEFINNGDLKTQLIGGSVIIEKADLIVANFADKILNTNQYKTRVYCSFEDAVELFTGGMKGFVRVQNAVGKVLKLHIADCAYVWQDSVLEIDRGEQRNESSFVTINSLPNNRIEINQTGYDKAQLAVSWFTVRSAKLEVYDKEGRNMITPTDFTEVFVNGVQYDNKKLFIDALSGII